MNLIKKRDEILTCCHKAEEKNNEIYNSNKHILIKKMAEQIYKRAKEISNICSVEKYDIFFNGKVAIGKSTIICTLFDFIDYDNLKIGTRLSNSLLLKTGSGRTTVCETRIVPHADKSEILVEGVSCEDFHIYLKDFCASLFGKESNISEEEVALIKNMAEIQLGSTAEEIVKEETDMDHLFEKFNEKIDYDNRNDKSFVFNGGEFKLWLKQTFSELNDGRIKTAPMPKKIIIKMNDNDAVFKIPTYINSIIDTRGLDGGERPDIQAYLQDDSAVSFMCDEINGYGGNESIISILRQTLIKEDKDKHHRVILLGMEKNGELDNITNFEDNRQEGIKEKKRQAMKKINDAKINLSDTNFLFFDTAPGISIEKGKITKIDQTVLQNTQKEFIDAIEDVILRMYSNYCDELYESLRLLEQLDRGQITTSTLQKINESYTIVADVIVQVRELSNNIIRRFEYSIKSIYHSSLRGAVNHWGEGKTADVYGSFQKCGGDEFIEQCREYKTKMITSITMIFENCNELEAICLKYILERIDDLYKNYYDDCRERAYSEIRCNLYNYNSWATPQQYWGDGKGSYNLRVWNDISQEIKQHHIDVKLAEQDSEVRFFQDILNFLKI